MNWYSSQPPQTGLNNNGPSMSWTPDQIASARPMQYQPQPGNPYMGMSGGNQGGYGPPTTYGPPMGYDRMPPQMAPPEYQDGAGGAPGMGIPPGLATMFGKPMNDPGMSPPSGGIYGGYNGYGGSGPFQMTPPQMPPSYGDDARTLPMIPPPHMSQPSNYVTNPGSTPGYWTPSQIASARPMAPYAPPPRPMGRPPVGMNPGGYRPGPYSPPGMRPPVGLQPPPMPPKRKPGRGGVAVLPPSPYTGR